MIGNPNIDQFKHHYQNIVVKFDNYEGGRVGGGGGGSFNGGGGSFGGGGDD